MKLNLQWISFPIFIYSLYNLITALLCIPYFWGPDISPLIAVSGLVIYGGWGLGFLLLGLLVWFAFRNCAISLQSDNK